MGGLAFGRAFYGGKFALQNQCGAGWQNRSYLQVLRLWIQARSGEWTTQTGINCDTFWLQPFGTRKSSLVQKKKKRVTLSLLLCFILYFVIWQFPSISSLGIIFGGAIYKDVFLRYEFVGLIFEGLIHEGDYFGNFTSLCECFGTNGICLSGYFRIPRTCEKHFIRIKRPSFCSNFLETVSWCASSE